MAWSSPGSGIPTNGVESTWMFDAVHVERLNPIPPARWPVILSRLIGSIARQAGSTLQQGNESFTESRIKRRIWTRGGVGQDDGVWTCKCATSHLNWQWTWRRSKIHENRKAPDWFSGSKEAWKILAGLPIGKPFSVARTKTSRRVRN